MIFYSGSIWSAIAHIQDYVNRDDWLKHICDGVEVEELVEIVNSVCICR